jgi:hypothetical protein
MRTKKYKEYIRTIETFSENGDKFLIKEYVNIVEALGRRVKGILEYKHNEYSVNRINDECFEILDVKSFIVVDLKICKEKYFIAEKSQSDIKFWFDNLPKELQKFEDLIREYDENMLE